MNLRKLAMIIVFSIIAACAVKAQSTTTILIKNANVFDGTSDKLQMGQSVLIEGNQIKKIAPTIDAPEGATVIDAEGNTLTPGFIDIHTHLQFNVSEPELLASTPDYLAALSLYEAEKTLMRGFTSIRDVGGAVFGVKKAIDEGYFPGPRIIASGPPLSMTSGHGDFRHSTTLPRLLGGSSHSEIEILGVTVFADGIPEVLSASRMNMRSGAAFLKMFVGGAVTGIYDPLDVVEYSYEEVKAAAAEAKRWNTYLSVHTYTDQATQNAINAGAKTLEHCNLISEETVKMAVKKGCYISVQTYVFLAPPTPSFTPAQKARLKEAAEGLDNLLKLCKKHKAKVSFGSDILMSLELKKNLNKEFTYRQKWFTNAEILKQATAINGEILQLSGPRNPYPGKIGVIEENALADILIVKGNPLEDISILTKPEENLLLIIKDGKIVKNVME